MRYLSLNAREKERWRLTYLENFQQLTGYSHQGRPLNGQKLAQLFWKRWAVLMMHDSDSGSTQAPGPLKRDSGGGGINVE